MILTPSANVTVKMFLFHEIEIGNVFRWIENNNNWPIQDIDSLDKSSRFITQGFLCTNDEFLVLDKREFDFRYAIRIMVLGKDLLGWVVCGHAKYPAIRIL